nr:hypothetical protein HK105_003993 [Polyrhizophydium stewartii]
MSSDGDILALLRALEVDAQRGRISRDAFHRESAVLLARLPRHGTHQVATFAGPYPQYAPHGAFRPGPHAPVGYGMPAPQGYFLPPIDPFSPFHLSPQPHGFTPAVEYPDASPANAQLQNHHLQQAGLVADRGLQPKMSVDPGTESQKAIQDGNPDVQFVESTPILASAASGASHEKEGVNHSSDALAPPDADGRLLRMGSESSIGSIVSSKGNSRINSALASPNFGSTEMDPPSADIALPDIPIPDSAGISDGGIPYQGEYQASEPDYTSAETRLPAYTSIPINIISPAMHAAIGGSYSRSAAASTTGLYGSPKPAQYGMSVSSSHTIHYPPHASGIESISGVVQTPEFYTPQASWMPAGTPVSASRLAIDTGAPVPGGTIKRQLSIARPRAHRRAGSGASATTHGDGRRPSSGTQVMPTVAMAIDASAKDATSGVPIGTFNSIAAMLCHRAKQYARAPELAAFVQYDGRGKEVASLDFGRFYSKALRVAEMLRSKYPEASPTSSPTTKQTQRQSYLSNPDASPLAMVPTLARTPVALLYRRQDWLDFAVALFGCMLAGHAAVPIVTSSLVSEEELAEVEFILDASAIDICLTTEANVRTLSKIYTQHGGAIPRVEWIKTNELVGSSLGRIAASKRTNQSAVLPEEPAWLINALAHMSHDDIAYIEYLKNASGEFKAVAVHHGMIMAQCALVQSRFGLGKHDQISVGLEPRQHIGLLFSTFMGVYLGRPAVVFTEPIAHVSGLWASCIAATKATVFVADANVTYDLMAAHSPNNPANRNSVTSPQAVLSPASRLSFGMRKRASQVQQPKGDELKTLRKFIINTERIPPGTCDALAQSLSLSGFAGKQAICTLFSLTEFGGAIIAASDEGSEASSDYAVKLVPLCDRRFELAEATSSYPGVVTLRDSGTPASIASIAIIDDETSSFVQHGCIGEIWAYGPNMPHWLWKLPRMTEHVLRARVEIGHDGGASVSGQRSPSHSPAHSTAPHDHVRTGLYGFLVSRHEAPWIPDGAQRLVVLGMARDIVFQRKLAQAPERPLPANGSVRSAGSGASPIEYNVYFAALLTQTVALHVRGVEAMVVFDVQIGSEYLPVVIVESARDDCRVLATQIHQVLVESNQLIAFAVIVCKPQTLPRMYANLNSGTGFQTAFTGFTLPSLLHTAPGTPLPVTLDLPMFVPQAASGDAGAPGAFKPLAAISVTKQQAVDVEGVRKMFLFGALPVKHLFLCGDQVIYRQIFNSREELAMLQGNLSGQLPGPGVNEDAGGGAAAAQAKWSAGQIVGGMKDAPILDDKIGKDLRSFPSILELLMWRAEAFPDGMALTSIDMRGRETKVVSFSKLSTKIHAMAQALAAKRHLGPGDHVLIMCTQSIEFVIAVWACLYVGIICIPLHPLDPARYREDVPVMLKIIGDFSVKEILVNNAVEDTLKSRGFRDALHDAHKACLPEERIASFPSMCNITRAAKTSKRMSKQDSVFQPRMHRRDLTAVVQVSFDEDMRPTFVRLSHRTIMEQCRIQAIQCRMLKSALQQTAGASADGRYAPPTSRPLVSCLRTFHGLGFVYSIFLGVYVGAGTYLVSPFDYFVNPQILFDTIHRYRIKDVFAPASMVMHAVAQMRTGDFRAFALHNLENCMVPAEGRTQPHILQAVAQTLAPNRLSDQALAHIYSSAFNPLVASRSYMAIAPTTVWLDSAMLRHGRVRVLRELRGLSRAARAGLDADAGLVDPDATAGQLAAAVVLQDCGKVVNNTVVAIVDPVTGRLCKPDEVGEIWVSSPATVEGLATAGDETDRRASVLSAPVNGQTVKLFDCVIQGVDPALRFMRTGDRGFLWPVPIEALEAQATLLGKPRATGWEGLVMAGLPYEMVLFTLGPLAADIVVNRQRLAPEDVEATIGRANAALTVEECMVFKSGDDVVATIECADAETAANSVARIVLMVLEQHHLLLNTLVFVQPGMLAKSRHNEKQRGRVAVAFASGKLPAIHIAHVGGASSMSSA